MHYIPKRLHTATHVWVRNHTPDNTFSPRYLGPFKILTRQPKTLTIDRNGKRDTISMDHCKPAHILFDPTMDTETPARSQQHAPHTVDAHADSKSHSDRHIHAETTQHTEAQQSTHSRKQTHHTQTRQMHTDIHKVPSRTLTDVSELSHRYTHVPTQSSHLTQSHRRQDRQDQHALPARENPPKVPKEVICIKLPRYPSWPAQIMEITDTPLANARVLRDSVALRLFGTNHFKMARRGDLLPFEVPSHSPDTACSRAFSQASDFIWGYNQNLPSTQTNPSTPPKSCPSKQTQKTVRFDPNLIRTNGSASSQGGTVGYLVSRLTRYGNAPGLLSIKPGRLHRQGDAGWTLPYRDIP